MITMLECLKKVSPLEHTLWPFTGTILVSQIYLYFIDTIVTCKHGELRLNVQELL